MVRGGVAGSRWQEMGRPIRGETGPQSMRLGAASPKTQIPPPAKQRGRRYFAGMSPLGSTRWRRSPLGEVSAELARAEVVPDHQDGAIPRGSGDGDSVEAAVQPPARAQGVCDVKAALHLVSRLVAIVHDPLCDNF